MEYIDQKSIPNGPAAAAFLAGGIGSFAVGLMTVLNEASPALSKLMTLSTAVGPLSGKVVFGLVIWLVVWLILGFSWRGKDVNIRGVITWAFVFLFLGILFTFPPFFEIFAAE